jgi:hypothetical protein
MVVDCFNRLFALDAIRQDRPQQYPSRQLATRYKSRDVQVSHRVVHRADDAPDRGLVIGLLNARATSRPNSHNKVPDAARPAGSRSSFP